MAFAEIPGAFILKQVGFFGGSFDPIHLGHLNLAIELLEKGGLDEILFCPAFCSPFKTATPPAISAHHRYEMVKQVIADVPQFRITSIEIEQDNPSFTIDTLRKLPKNGIQYRLILSEEGIERFHQWKEPEEVLRLAPPIIGSRSLPHHWNSLEFKKAFVATSLFDISGTEVRERLKKKMYCGHLVPQKALDYIERNDLY